jgi:hypothetical protein
MRGVWLGLLGGPAVVVLAACGPGAVVADETSRTASVYEGPLYVPVVHPDHPDPMVRSGAAGLALECEGEPFLGSTGRNWGALGGGSDPTEGLVRFVSDGAASLPRTGYRVEREQGERVLFSYDVAGETKVAVIVAENVSNGFDQRGWGMETFAQCNPAEFDPANDDELPARVWTDRHGSRVPTTKVMSYAGPEHCGWHSATFLALHEDSQFVRDPQGLFGQEWLEATFARDIRLPTTAVDTGYRLDDWELWLAADRSAAYVITGEGTERWPAAKRPILCA